MRTRNLWIVHLVTLLVVVLWAMFDLRFESMVRALPDAFARPTTSTQQVIESVGIVRVLTVIVTAVLAVSSMAGLHVRHFSRSHHARSRSIASLIAITTVIAVWLGISVNYQSLAWQGQRIRVAVQLRSLEAIAEPLRRNWPKEDDEIAGIGPFMAYPFGQPSTLILLQSPPVSGDGLCIAAVERSPRGAIRFELTGTEHDDWVEWHPPGSYPTSFVGGLKDPHQFVCSTKLRGGWHLVRYSKIHHSPSINSRPLRVPNECQMSRSMESVIDEIEPSTLAT